MNSDAQESQESEPDYTIHDLYTFFRTRTEARKITDGTIEYDSDDEGYYEAFLYHYTPADEHDLEVQIRITNVDESIAIVIGPAYIELSLPATKQEAQSLLRDVIALLQMILNGQLVVVVSVQKKDDSWQAAEVVWIDERGNQKMIFAIPHYTFGRLNLTAHVLRNHQKYPPVTIAQSHFLQPAKVNGREIVGRDIDLAKPTPMTRKAYEEYDMSLTVQAVGGEQGEKLWEVFYRRVEFWVVCVIIGLPAIGIVAIIPDDAWWSTPALGLTGVAGLLTITFVTILLLSRRQAMIDSGKIPLAERIEDHLNYRAISAGVALLLMSTFFFAPIWTTREEPQKLITAFESSVLVPPLAVSCALIFVAMVIVVPTSRMRKIARSLIFLAGYAGCLLCNFVVLYGGDDAAYAPVIPTLIISILPVGIIIWYISDCFRRIPRAKA